MKPRVIVLTTTFPRRPGDGTPRFVSDLATALSDRFTITVITPRVPSAPSTEMIGDVEVIRFPYAPQRFEGLADGAIVANLRAQPFRALELPGLVCSMWLALRRELKNRKPHLVHAHWCIPTGLVASAHGRRLRRPVLITCHGVDLHAFKVAPLEALRKLAFRRASAVTTVSAELARRARSLGAGDDVPVIPMGVDIAELAKLKPLEREPDRVLFVGRLAEKKGVGVLLEALVALPAVNLRIVGDGPLLDDLGDQAQQLGLDSRVCFLGQQDRESVLQELRLAAVLVIPSVTASDGDREGTPVVLAEAIATDTPVVVSDVGGLGELVSDQTGWVVPEGSASALARAIDQSLTTREAPAKARTARAKLLPQLSLETTAAAYAQMFCELTDTD